MPADPPNPPWKVQTSFEVEVRSGLTLEALEREYVSRSTPVLLAGVMRGLPVMTWTPDSVAAAAPCRVVPVAFYRAGNPYDLADRVERSMSVVDYVATLRRHRSDGHPHPYLLGHIASHLPELLQDAQLPHLPDRDRQVDLDILMGKDSVSGAHFHSRAHAMVSQVHGRKVAVIHPPSETPRLDPYPVYHPYYCHGRARFDDPQRYRKLGEARAAVITLEPGDALFVPARWWHTLFGRGETITVSYFWGVRRFRQMVSRPLPRAVMGLILEPTLHRFLMPMR